MKERILNILDVPKALQVKEIANKLGIDEEYVSKELDEMCESLDLIKTKKNKYTLFERGKLEKGIVLIVKGGYGFVNFGGTKDAFIQKNNLNGAMNGDLVAIEICNKNKDKIEAKVVKVVKDKNRTFVGEILNKKDCTYILLDNNKNNLIVSLSKRNNELVNGTKVVVELKDKIGENAYTADIQDVLGHKNDPGVDLLSIVRTYNITPDFPAEVLKELENIPSELTNEEINKKLENGFKDLRDDIIFTIDGDDTKDIDDAISIKILSNGNYELSIHIANVSNYVTPDSQIWNDAVKRGTSVYMPGSSIPMLPRKLSNGICSLNPKVDRLAMTFKMEIDKNGNVVDFDVFESIIRSRKQMTYNDVNKILENDIIPEGYEDYEQDLKIMNNLAHLLRRNRIKRGFIDFGIDENKIDVDEQGKVIDIKLRTRGEAEKLIEDFMVETGEQASKYLDDNGLKDNHVYRVHGEPNEEKISNLKMFLSSLNYKTRNLDDLSPKNMQKLLEEMKDKKEYLIIAREILKCMQKAIYSPNNIGHFALASSSTCQVTSPIRRSGDLINHVLIKDAIYKTKSSIDNKKELAKLSVVASQTERNAESCERETDKMKMAEYMQNHIGEEFTGMITSVVKSGFFVEFPNLIEGFVNINDLTDDNYVYDKEKFCFIGRCSHTKYRLGDQVSVKVINASKSARRIELELVESKDYKIKKLSNLK